MVKININGVSDGNNVSGVRKATSTSVSKSVDFNFDFTSAPVDSKGVINSGEAGSYMLEYAGVPRIKVDSSMYAGIAEFGDNFPLAFLMLDYAKKGYLG